MTLRPVDRLEVLVLIDNTIDILSSTPAHIESEGQRLGLLARRARGGKHLCCAAHGLSLLVTAYRGDTRRAMLFDTGPEDYAFKRNVTRLGIDLGDIDSLLLSHGHWDHAGAMLYALGAIRARNGGRSVPCWLHPGMFRPRGTCTPSGLVRPMERIPSVEELESFGAECFLTEEPQALHNGMFWISGKIPRVTPFERGLPGHMRRTEDGSGWEADDFLMDERFLVVDVASKGLVVFSACSHAGIVNVLTHARACFPNRPLHAAMGGLHLSGANEAIIPETVDRLAGFGLKMIAAGHCTGWRALGALSRAFCDDVLAPTAVGKTYRF